MNLKIEGPAEGTKLYFVVNQSEDSVFDGSKEECERFIQNATNYDFVTKLKWIDVDVPAGKPQVRARVEPMPNGPYFWISQFEEVSFVRAPANFYHRAGYFTADCPFGYSAWIMVAGSPFRVAYWYDTSD